MGTSGAEMLPVLLEELKSASLPEKQRRGRSMKGRKLAAREPAGRCPAPWGPRTQTHTDAARGGVPALPGSQRFPPSRREEAQAWRRRRLNTAWKHREAGFLDAGLPADELRSPGRETAPAAPSRFPGRARNVNAPTPALRQHEKHACQPQGGFSRRVYLSALQSASHTWIWHVGVWR